MFTNSDEIKSIVARSRPYKAAGSDGVINLLLKRLPDSAFSFLADIFNECLRQSYWPKHFASAKVIAIPKAGRKCSNISDFRPISLLNSTGKLFERIIYSRISDYGNINNIFNANQFGFRPQHSDLKLRKNIQIACFADDTAIYTSANRTKTITNALQTALSNIDKYFSSWKIKINPQKTQAILFPFNRQRKRIPNQSINLNGAELSFSNEVKYLGMILDKHLIFASHISATCLKVNAFMQFIQ